MTVTKHHAAIWIRLLICFFAFSGCARSIHAEMAACSAGSAIKAEETAPLLSNWKELHSFFLEYSPCDDGAVAEGLTDSVSRLLVARWNTVSELLLYFEADPRFESFFFRHVNDLIPKDIADDVVEKSRNQCPAGGVDFCMKLRASLQ